MKICIVSHFSSFDKKGLQISEISGGTKHTYALFNEWLKLNNEISLINEPLNFNFINMIAYIFSYMLRKPLNITQCDIIIGNTPYPPDLLDVLRTKLKLHKAAIVYFHHLPPPLLFHPFKRGFSKTILNVFYSKFAVAICKIFDVGIFLEQPQAFKLGSIKVYRNDVALDIKEDIGILTKRMEKDVDIFYMGGISKSKGFIDLLQALKILQTRGISLKVVVIGKMNDTDKDVIKLKYKIASTGLNIDFTGVVSEQTKIEFFSRAKMYVTPSYVEGWSLAVMEAARFRVPIVAYDLAAYSYLGGNFYKVKPGNIKQLAKQIENCLSNSELNKLFVERAFNFASKYNYPDIAKFQINLFKSLID